MRSDPYAWEKQRSHDMTLEALAFLAAGESLKGPGALASFSQLLRASARE